MSEIIRCKRKASNIEPLKAIIGNFYWGVLLDPQGNFLELTGGVEKLTGGSTPPTPSTIQSLRLPVSLCCVALKPQNLPPLESTYMYEGSIIIENVDHVYASEAITLNLFEFAL